MDPYQLVIEARIRTLWSWRNFWRQHNWAEYPLQRHLYDHELRMLVRLAREARRLEATIPDPITTAKAEDYRGDHYLFNAPVGR